MKNSVRNAEPESEGSGASSTDRVAHEIVVALEQGRLTPGQRLVESELAVSLGVGRNAVREAIQRLAAKGIVDLSRNRSPSIRQLDLAETLEVLEVAEEMFGVLARVAARGYVARSHQARLRGICLRLRKCRDGVDRTVFNDTRREFYRTLLEIGGNRELRRHFATIQMQIIYVQFESADLFETRLKDYQAVCEAVMSGDERVAEKCARGHARRVRDIIQKLPLPADGRL